MAIQTVNSAAVPFSTIFDIEKVIDAFVSEDYRIESTRNVYYKTTRFFFSWVISTGRKIDRLTAIDVQDYVRELMKEGKSSLTVTSYLNSVRRFFKWTESHKIYPNIAATVKLPKRRQEFQKQPLTIRKAAELLTYAENLNARDYAIINLMSRTGLRCIEVVRANVEDITMIPFENEYRRVLKVQGKGHEFKDDWVILDDDAYNPIKTYLNTRSDRSGRTPLFESVAYHTAKECNHNEENYNARRLSTRTVSKIVKEALKAVGLDCAEFTAHSLRHTVGTNILRAGGSLEQAQMTLRHSNPATTEIYARMALKENRFKNGGEMLLSRLYAAELATNTNNELK